MLPMKKMKEVPVRDRPREKIACRGVSVLSDNELIEAIIGRGTKNKDVREISREIGGLIQQHRDNLRYKDLEEWMVSVRPKPPRSLPVSSWEGVIINQPDLISG